MWERYITRIKSLGRPVTRRDILQAATVIVATTIIGYKNERLMNWIAGCYMAAYLIWVIAIRLEFKFRIGRGRA
jgi:hypothetical protein